MNAQLQYILYQARTSFWFLPAVITLLALLASQATLYVDRVEPGLWRDSLGWLYRVGPEGARQFLATTATSLITVTSLVFSLTLVVLTMASSQFGPRLITIFLRDRVNQLVLGAFAATFLYALLILRTIDGSNGETFVPHLSLAVALAMAVTSVGLLIYFIHHVATGIQADVVIASVTRDLNDAVGRMFTEAQEPEDAVANGGEDAADTFAAEGKDVRVARTGYIQAVDHDLLVKLAARHDLLARLTCRAGHFVVAGEVVAHVAPAARAGREVQRSMARAFVIGGKRTMAQDIEYALDALVELAVRALSPGINDPHTAIACIDQISGALARTTKLGLPPAVIKDAERRPRLLLDIVTYAGLLDTAFSEIRQSAGAHVAVLIRLAAGLTRLAEFAREPEQRQAIARHAAMLRRTYEANVHEPEDRADIEERLRPLQRLLDGAGAARAERSAGRPSGGRAPAS